MHKKLNWIPGLLIMAGGLYTIHYIDVFIKETHQMLEQSIGLMRGLAAVTLALSGGLIFPLVMGGIVGIIGAITIWKKNFFLALISLIFAATLLNWVGSILCCIGGITGMIMWRKQLHDDDKME
ncbi:hypothetical protein [Oceanobacillus saliphilus]|uniref:hypothetical protein n=1 Tax=Oceanobacillus saliphilus TaxID=2925834 RepID=UPI00201E5C74|nr:hypothetical protein [Oceanobacillus saliphilus]